MVRPTAFGFNPDAAESNAFMVNDGMPREEIRNRAIHEFDELVRALRGEGVRVVVFQDTEEPHTPDSIFPNNWFDSDREGMVIIYPMCPTNRRLEHQKGRKYVRQLQIEHGFDLNKIVDLTPYEMKGKFLEGTGSMVFDCVNRVSYACLSSRTDTDLLEEFCQLTGYEVVSFKAVDRAGQSIYHTNVMMSVGDAFAVVCSESIVEKDRARVLKSLRDSGREVVEISFDQMEHFAGNVLQLVSASGESLLAMSRSAHDSFSDAQVQVLEKYVRIVSSPIPTIEKYGGGSVRCMLAEIFLTFREHGRLHAGRKRIPSRIAGS